MKDYDHKAIEKKWRDEWERTGIYRVENGSKKQKQYILDMFPYPSGDGLHVGHPKGYIATDIYSRMKRMQSFNVLHPMGWDAFGLPAENYAIKNKVHPRTAVERNVKHFKDQLALIGLDYDWTREINTTDPTYYKWTQWIFLKLLERGLAYESTAPINWCPSCQTGLANEDIESDGTCERCGSKVEKRPMRQWVLKITTYADRLLKDLDKLPDWPGHIKEQQRNWIGRKEGIVMPHKVVDSSFVLETFSAYPAWLFADTYLVIAPEHPLVPDLVRGTSEEATVMAFVKEMSTKSAIERGGEGGEKLGVFTGRFVEDPLRPGEKMPVWLANFALMDFGTGIIRCSAHDPRDVEFAKKYAISLRQVVGEPGTFVNAHDNAGVLKDSGPFTGKDISPSLIKEMVDWFEAEGLARRHVSYRIQDWVFSRQRYWGEPIPVVHCEKCGTVPVPESELPVTLPDVEHYEPTGTGESPLANIAEWVNTTCPKCGGKAKRETNTMPQWAGSSWYWLRFMDPQNDEGFVGKGAEAYWGPVDVYVGGDHAVRHLIYARFWHKVFFDMGLVHSEEPFSRLEFLGFILAEDGRKMSKRWGNVINPDDVIATFGADAFRTYEMFMGPFENTIAWSTNGLVGTRRFIERVWRMGTSDVLRTSDVQSLEAMLHQTIKKVGEDITAFKFNTAVSQMMIFLNEAETTKMIGKEQFGTFLKVLAPFAPHVTEELWHQMGHTTSIHTEKWPEYDEAKLVTSEVTIVVQIGGKTRGTVALPRGSAEGDVLAAARKDEKMAQYIPESPKRIVFVLDRILNIIP